MSARLTVVLDDEGLYRSAKVAAAERGVPLKAIIEEALRSYLESKPEEREYVEFDWEEYDRWQAEVKQLAEELGDDAPTDLSDIKKYLYSGWDSEGRRGPEPRRRGD